MYEFYDVEQNTDEWFGLRSGSLTSSNLGCVMAKYGKAFGDPAKQLAIKIAIEQITGKPVEGGYSNSSFDRGHEEEPIARMLYEQETFSEVTNGGYFDAGFEGCSPDGLVNEDGVIEIKSAIPHIHYARVKRQDMDPTYKWQCVNTLKITARDWLDFISYCSSYPEGKRLYVFRMHKRFLQGYYDMIDLRVAEFKILVQESLDSINGSQYRLEGTQ